MLDFRMRFGKKVLSIAKGPGLGPAWITHIKHTHANAKQMNTHTKHIHTCIEHTSTHIKHINMHIKHMNTNIKHIMQI